MVVKTEKCAFSEYPVFPGHGMKYVRRDGQPLILGTSKAKSLYFQRIKPSKLHWTQGWRRLNKKGLAETTTKKRSRKTTKVTRAIVGFSAEEIKRVRNQKPQEKSAAREAALRELKERKKKEKAAKASAKKAQQGGAKQKVAQNTKGFNKSARAGGKR